MNNCLFCTILPERIIAQNDLAYAIRDGFPVTDLHTLVIPKRHVEDFFGLTDEEILGCNRLILEVRETILKQDPTVQGFNIGMNAGEVAGQTVFHCHIHLIPRRKGDVENPRGGVRHTIPGKGHY
ncbi:HIT family protein [Herbaspirillum sp. GCM10030257]|uniref:HIT family protein n=1 Tax=Herbaspirillum sp. GCM10030257 TaxID=3273393 RepID=UPI00360F5A4A